MDFSVTLEHFSILSIKAFKSCHSLRGNLVKLLGPIGQNVDQDIEMDSLPLYCWCICPPLFSIAPVYTKKLHQNWKYCLAFFDLKPSYSKFNNSTTGILNHKYIFIYFSAPNRLECKCVIYIFCLFRILYC